MKNIKNELNSKKNILITDRYDQDCFLYLQSQSFLQLRRSESPFSIAEEDLKDAHAIVIRSRTAITEDLLKRAPNLQVIITCTSGFDHIDFSATARWGVTVMHTPDAHIESASQLTWALILSCANQIGLANKMVRSGDWSRDRVVGFELSNKTIGVVGLGRIGARVAKVALAFGMKVLAFDPYQDDAVFKDLEIERMSYEEVLKMADVLTFHVPKTAETNFMLNRSHFEYIHRGVILINASRGSVINETDLCEALDQGWVRAVGLDVFEKEPLAVRSRLLQNSLGKPPAWLDRVVFTPHIGANTDDAFYKGSFDAAEKLIRFFMDSSTSDTLPPKAAWYGATPFGKSS